MNTTTLIPAIQRRRAQRWRFNPLRRLDPETLSRHIDAFEAGRLREAVEIFEALEQRDDLLRAVVSKRKKAVGRHGWTILPMPGIDPGREAEARAHAAALDHFYRHLQCGHALDTAERGGFNLLVRQMMDAVGKGHAVHEMVWTAETAAQWRARGGVGPRLLRAEFRFVPLLHFEKTTGELRFLADPAAMEGEALEPGAWMVTTGECLMKASATAWMLKNICLNDWLLFCERNGRPGLRGVTTAPRDSEEWRAMEESVAQLLEGASVVHGAGEEIKVIDLAAGGAIPFPRMVERIDRLLAVIWRGADLGTLSRDRGYGASLQERESCVLEEDDTAMVNEALNRQVDTWVVRHLFGPGVEPLARVHVHLSPRECTSQDLQVDRFLLEHGAPITPADLMLRYGRALPSGLKLSAKPAPAPAGPEREPGSPMANEFQLTQPDWVQLSPHGDFPHARGTQRVTPEVVARVVREFDSLAAKLERLFGGLPFYIGHPDLPTAAPEADRKAYGWITQLEARPDGLFARVKWSDPGLELLRQGHYKYLSPLWEAAPAGVERGRQIYHPERLVSAGLTNTPNLPLRPLANTRPPAPDPIDGILDAAYAEGLLTPAQEAEWRDRLANDSARQSFALGAQRPPLHVRPRGVGLARWGATARRELLRARVRERMRDGATYDEAWAGLRREHPSLFEGEPPAA